MFCFHENIIFFYIQNEFYIGWKYVEKRSEKNPQKKLQHVHSTVMKGFTEPGLDDIIHARTPRLLCISWCARYMSIPLRLYRLCMQGDFGMVRLLQMLWRLNFLVFFLCMVMDNHYVLYYICPLHTFYFLMVYLIMAPVRSANYTKNGMRWKLAAAALFISAVWDWDIGLFDKVVRVGW